MLYCVYCLRGLLTNSHSLYFVFPSNVLCYYKRTQMSKGENEPIGILLCARKNDAVVKYTLPEGRKQIFVSKYVQYLPTEEELKAELLREKEVIEMEFKLNKDKQ